MLFLKKWRNSSTSFRCDFLWNSLIYIVRVKLSDVDLRRIV